MPSKVHESRSGQEFTGSSFVYTPLQHVRTLFISFLQGLFEGSPAGCFKWDPDPEKTEIAIRDENPIKVETVGQRPAINLTLGSVQFYSLGMDDMLYYDQATGRKVKGVLIPGTVSINCCSRVDIEAHNIAWSVAEFIWLLREEFLKRGFFELGRGNQVTPPTPAGSIVANDSGDEWYCSTVIIPFQFQRKSAFTKLGARIVQNIETRLSTVLGPVESVGPPQGGHEFPVSETYCLPESFAPNASDAYGATPDPTGQFQGALIKQPHPLNPAVTVTVRAARPNRAGLRNPSMHGRELPIVRPCVKESKA